MKFRYSSTLVLLLGASFVSHSAQAVPITYTDLDLGGGNPVSVGGVTLTTSTVGGSIDFITSGTYAGLNLGRSSLAGVYTFTFSGLIDSIEIEFDALTYIPTYAPETLTNFATSNGGVTINYVNQLDTVFDGVSISATAGDGQGIIQYSGPTFSSFSFDYSQGIGSGFVIERILINTVVMATVPEPGTFVLLLAGLVGLLFLPRRTA